MMCLECKQYVYPYEVYTDWYYCEHCQKNHAMPTGRKQCKPALHGQRERLNPEALEFSREVCDHLRMITQPCDKCGRCDSPNTPTKGSDPNRND